MATPSASNKLFWLGFAFTSYAIARSFSWYIHELFLARRHKNGLSESVDFNRLRLESTETSPPKQEAKKQGTEDDLSIATLEVLSRHPNYDIRQAACKVALYRFAHSDECTARLRRDLRDPQSRPDATDALRSLVTEVDSGVLLGGDVITDPHDFDTFLDDFISVGEDRRQSQVTSRQPQRQARPLERQGPMLTLEEVEGENGEIVSVRVPALTMMSAMEGRLAEGDTTAGEQELRRWQRREAMVVQFDNEEEEEDDEDYVPEADDGDTSSDEDDGENNDNDDDDDNNNNDDVFGGGHE